MMAMDEDTVIVLGFALGAVALMVLVFVWVLVYCLCCRTNSRYRYKRADDRSSKHYGNSLAQSQQSYFNSSRQGDLPDIPPADVENGNPPLPPGHPQSQEDSCYLNEALEGAYTEPIYSYCDTPFYQAPVPRDTHAYDQMQPSDPARNVPKSKPSVINSKKVVQTSMLDVPRVAQRTVSNGSTTEGYVDIMQTDLSSEQIDGDNINISRQSTILASENMVGNSDFAERRKISSNSNTEQAERGKESNDSNTDPSSEASATVCAATLALSPAVLPIDNDIYFESSDSDTSSEPENDDYYHKLEKTDSDTTSHSDDDLLNIEKSAAAKEEDYAHSYCNVDLNSINNKDVYNTVSKPEHDIQDESEENSETAAHASNADRGLIPVPRPRKPPQPEKNILFNTRLPLEETNNCTEGAMPEPTPRQSRTPSNPPPYDQIVDYGQ